LSTPAWEAMASQVTFRQVFCRAVACGATFFICGRCYRGQAYCSAPCRHKTRQQQRREANRRYQQDPGVGLDHRDRQREYRKRVVARRVTDQSSTIGSTWGSICEPAAKTETESPPTEESCDAPKITWLGRLGLIVCHICGRLGQWIGTFVLRE
jgi:hypothetical protein